MVVIDASHRIIAELLSARTGQQLTQSRMWRVPSALAGLCRERGVRDVDQLVGLLADPRERDLATQVVEALLNNETYFFRDHACFQRLTETVLPELHRRHAGNRRIAIWSAGCSTGQEALSIAMLFADQPEKWAGWTVEIVGTDVSSRAIVAANRGVYSQFEIQRGIGVRHMLKYFTETSDGWQAAALLRAATRFERRNLLDTPPVPHAFDLVLCRNVLLYFDAPTRALAFARLAQGVDHEGWLMLGSGETVVGQTDLFAPAPCGASLYAKQPAHRAVQQAFADRAVGLGAR